MARINVDDPFWIDVVQVAMRIGDLDRAVGLCLRWMQYAQVAAKSGQPISLDDFKQRFNMALAPEFATIIGDTVVPAGEADQFDWLMPRAEAGQKGGSKTSQAKREAARQREAKKRAEREAQANHKQSTNPPQATTDEHKTTTEHNPSTTDHNCGPQHKQNHSLLVVQKASDFEGVTDHKESTAQASPSFSPSPSFSRSQEDIQNTPSGTEAAYAAPPVEGQVPTRPGSTPLLPGLPSPQPPKKSRKPVVDGKTTQGLVAHYCDEWKKRYGPKSPDMFGKATGQLQTLIRDVGESRARTLVTAYLRMPDTAFVRKRHDIPTLVNNLTAVGHYANSGKMITNNELRQLDAAVTNKQTYDAIDKGEI